MTETTWKPEYENKKDKQRQECRDVVQRPQHDLQLVLERRKEPNQLEDSQ